MTMRDLIPQLELLNCWQQFRWEVFDHPSYSPDLAPSDYLLFMHLKKCPASQSFEDEDRLKTDVTTLFKSLVADFFDTGIRKLCATIPKMCGGQRGLCGKIR